MKKSVFNNQKGYTFFELVVVLALFSIISSIVATIFVLFSRAQTRTITNQNLISDTRYIVETLVRDVRNGRIDYARYSDPVSDVESSLYLIDENGDNVEYHIVQDGCAELVDNCLQIVRGGNSAILSSNTTNIAQMHFYIYPVRDPFSFSQGVFKSNEQPGVTVAIVSEAVDAQGDIPIQINLQTTVSSKQYVR